MMELEGREVPKELLPDAGRSLSTFENTCGQGSR